LGGLIPSVFSGKTAVFRLSKELDCDENNFRDKPFGRTRSARVMFSKTKISTSSSQVPRRLQRISRQTNTFVQTTDALQTTPDLRFAME